MTTRSPSVRAQIGSKNFEMAVENEDVLMAYPI